MAAGEPELRAILAAACRETLEEAAILPVLGGAASITTRPSPSARAPPKAQDLGARSSSRAAWSLDLAALCPRSRWISADRREARRLRRPILRHPAPQLGHNAAPPRR